MRYLKNLDLFVVVLLAVRKVIAALSAGLLSKFGLIVKLAAPEVKVGVAVTVYTKATPLIVNVSPI